LAAKYYCHFTSPIRRYPDLQIHRIIKDNLNGRLTEERKEHYLEFLNEVAAQSSKTERTAEEAERDVEKMKKVEYMERRIGEVYDGVISGVTNWGIYVELPNTVEGIIHLENIQDDFYRFDEQNYQLVGDRFHKVYRLGQHITIMVLSVDKLLKTVDFLPFKR
jgi:ribonuclease R